MKQIDVGYLTAGCASLAIVADRLEELTKGLGPQGMAEVSMSGIGPMYLFHLAHVNDTVEWLDLPAGKAAAARCKASINRFVGANRGVIGRDLASEIITNTRALLTSLQDEMKEHRTFVVAPKEAKMLDGGNELFGEKVDVMFPSARDDINAAARCRAFEMWHATVAHSMRVAEIGVGALANRMGATIGNSWGDTASALRKALSEVNAKNGDSTEKEWASEAGTHLEFIRKGWRNPAMHPGKTFDREQAISIYDNTRSFMRMLAEKLAH